ncbi:MAG: hypothetical protein ACRD4O_03575 [Bryobacteraceae bacterium]
MSSKAGSDFSFGGLRFFAKVGEIFEPALVGVFTQGFCSSLFAQQSCNQGQRHREVRIPGDVNGAFR